MELTNASDSLNSRTAASASDGMVMRKAISAARQLVTLSHRNTT
jgi:hypothetical protein